MTPSQLRLASGLAVLLLLVTQASSEPREHEVAEEGSDRQAKLFNVFQVVRFPNDDCNTTSGDSGVCYTLAECTSRSGSNSGSCANGFGVCCSFSIGCGDTSSQNNTYFTNSDSDTSPCTATICRCDTNICQLRLDFDTFQIAQPDATADTGTAAATVAAADPCVHVPRGTCINANFVATSEGGSRVPTICGNNNGFHMILEADPGCNQLSFSWTDATTRTWKIKVSQISCNDPNKPPENCLQYFTGTTGTVASYNWNNGAGPHLADQDYTNCIRTEQGYCQINWVEATVGSSFELTFAGGTATTMSSAYTGAVCSKDYVHIKGAFQTTSSIAVERLCGDHWVTLDTAANVIETTAYTVASRLTPFTLAFHTDGGECDATTLAGDDTASAGFQLNYVQTTC